jgi:hexosaminidase
MHLKVLSTDFDITSKLMKFLSLFAFWLLILCGCKRTEGSERTSRHPEPLPVGYSVPVLEITEAKMMHARSVGIEYIEVGGMNALVEKDRRFVFDDDEMAATLQKVRDAATKAGIKIWSVHMPYGAKMDLSLSDEDERRKVVEVHSKLLQFLKVLEPHIILFHPSYYLGLNEREVRKAQMIKSATELNESVRALGATMVIENMLGYELLKDENRERPLCRTVEETVEIMNALPESIYSAIDMNHIIHPERLIRAMGSRLRSVHVADGTGKEENHFFPCSGEGQNDWIEILIALDEVGYNGPFLFESSYPDEKDLIECYNTLYKEFTGKISSTNN